MELIFIVGKININFHAVAHHNMVFSDVFLPEKPMLVLQTLIVLLRIVVNGRFCPQSVRNFCPIVAGFNAGTYKVPACVL